MFLKIAFFLLQISFFLLQISVVWESWQVIGKCLLVKVTWFKKMMSTMLFYSRKNAICMERRCEETKSNSDNVLYKRKNWNRFTNKKMVQKTIKQVISKYIEFQFILPLFKENTKNMVLVIRGIYQEKTCAFMVRKTTS